jgi:zinc D-Ala-D-Ala carboxypeptidase
MNLSEHFTLEELTFSNIALREGVANTPGAQEIANLTTLANTLLEPGRLILGVPWCIDSGYRSPTVNALARGSTNSAHMRGGAADVRPVAVPLRNAFNALRTSTLPYDQLIMECNAWLHIAAAPAGQTPRREALFASWDASAKKWQYWPAR